MLNVGSHIHFIAVCEKTKNPIEENVKVNTPYLYINADHLSIVEVIFSYFVYMTETLVWYYIDLFLMIIGIALTTQFKIFNTDLEYSMGRVAILLPYFHCTIN